jgi:hypothetical protein
VLVNIMLEIRENLPPRRDHPRAAFAPHRVTLCVKAVLGLSQVFRSYYLRAPEFEKNTFAIINPVDEKGIGGGGVFRVVDKDI